MIHALYHHSIWSWISSAFRAWHDSIQEALIPDTGKEAEDSGTIERITIHGADAA